LTIILKCYILIIVKGKPTNICSYNIEMVTDIIVILIIIGSVLLGVSQGFFKGAFGIVKFIVAIVLAVLLSGAFSNLVNAIAEAISGQRLDVMYTQRMADNLTERNAIFGVSGGYTEAQVKAALASLSLPAFIINLLAPALMNALAGSTASLGYAVAAVIVRIIMDILAFLLVFLIVFIILTIVVNVLSKYINQNKYAKGVNQGLGAVFGLLKGLLVVWISLCIIGFLGSIVAFIQNDINNGIGIARFLQEYNPISAWLNAQFDYEKIINEAVAPKT